MKPYKIAIVVGARPQFIKAAALWSAYRQSKFRRALKLVWIHTGQHYDYALSGNFFKEFCLPKPDYHLKIGSLSAGAQTGRMMAALERVFLNEKPDAVLVFGDTTSTIAGALSAAKLGGGCVLAHVEAGMRSFNRAMPEETNRVVTDHLSDLLLCPLSENKKQLAREGIRQNVYVTGDVMADILLKYKKKISRSLKGEPYYVATIHRNTNTDDSARLAEILGALGRLGKRVLFPLHPRTKKIIERSARLRRLVEDQPDLKILPPVSYADMLRLQRNACGVITDSGGVQKEAFLLGVPCVTLRAETEWTETVRYGRNILSEPKPERIIAAFDRMAKVKNSSAAPALFGRGDASEKILKLLLARLRKRKMGKR